MLESRRLRLWTLEPDYLSSNPKFVTFLAAGPWTSYLTPMPHFPHLLTGEKEVLPSQVLMRSEQITKCVSGQDSSWHIVSGIYIIASTCCNAYTHKLRPMVTHLCLFLYASQGVRSCIWLFPDLDIVAISTADHIVVIP